MTDLKIHAISVPLRQWIQDEAKSKALDQRTKGTDQIIRLKKQSILRKATVGYGIVELLRHVRTVTNQCSTMATLDPAKECTVDNFVVHVSRHVQAIECTEQAPWNDVMGVSMISPALSAQLIEPSFLADIFDENIQDTMGRYLEVVITAPASSNPTTLLPRDTTNIGVRKISDGNDCHLLGILLYELYSGMCPFPAESNDKKSHQFSHKEPWKKKSSVRYDKKKGKSYSTLQTKLYAPLQELGFPSSICLLVQGKLQFLCLVASILFFM